MLNEVKYCSSCKHAQPDIKCALHKRPIGKSVQSGDGQAITFNAACADWVSTFAHPKQKTEE